ncbi:MAG: hypothetical protein JST82_03190 [Bacteroidetes bacterium]|nr:hypothetical protein [Bacteroidota bacterium]
MDIILLVIAGFYFSNKAKNNGLNTTFWVLNVIGFGVLFEILGGVIAFVINGGNLILAALFGFVAALGGVLLTNYRIDKVIAQNKTTNQD